MARLTQATSTSGCCAPEAQQSCCEPSEKAACCETNATGGTCDCAAGRAAPAEDLRETVRARYAAAAIASTGPEPTGCCDANGAVITNEQAGLFGARLYADDDRTALPDTAVPASLGCGNPTAVAELHEGETVLDLGSGGGIDILSLPAASAQPAPPTAWT